MFFSLHSSILLLYFMRGFYAMKSTFKALFLALTMALFVLPAVSDGVTDNTNIFQKLLNRLGDLGGGTLYVPTGKYVIKGNLTIPKGVTLLCITISMFCKKSIHRPGMYKFQHNVCFYNLLYIYLFFNNCNVQFF